MAFCLAAGCASCAPSDIESEAAESPAEEAALTNQSERDFPHTRDAWAEPRLSDYSHICQATYRASDRHFDADDIEGRRAELIRLRDFINDYPQYIIHPAIIIDDALYAKGHCIFLEYNIEDISPLVRQARDYENWPFDPE